MEIRNKFEFLKTLFLSVALMACSFTTNAISTTTATPTTPQKTSTPEATPTIKATSTPHYSVEFDKIIKIKSGGFSFSQLKGYKNFGDDNLGAYLISPDKQVEIGIFAYPRPGGSTITGLLSSWRAGFSNDFDSIDFSDPVEETKNEIGSVSTEFTGMEKEVPLQGRLTIHEPPNAKLIYLYIIAYGDQRWQREGQKVFETTANSIQLFEITALENCPTTKNENYGYVKTDPIKIGGGAENGWARIHDYLGTLLGRKGEIISYNSSESTTYNGVELDAYVIRIGNDYKTLYFDKADFEEPLVPHGLTCSGPLPGKPGNGPASNG